MEQTNNIIKKYASELITKKEEDPSELSNYEVQEMLEKYTFELLSADIDFRIHMKYRDWTTECLWYLGDKAQRDYSNNGWVNYRFRSMPNSIHQIPAEKKVYKVYYNDIIDTSYWNGKEFEYFDKYITHWKEETKPKD